MIIIIRAFYLKKFSVLRTLLIDFYMDPFLINLMKISYRSPSTVVITNPLIASDITHCLFLPSSLPPSIAHLTLTLLVSFFHSNNVNKEEVVNEAGEDNEEVRLMTDEAIPCLRSRGRESNGR